MISNILTLKQLEALIWVADLGSFRRAAEHLNTTQPNISARIAGLETALGVTLMTRDAGSVRLTEKGGEILDAARSVLRQTESILDVAQRPDLVTGRLRLGVTELVACTWLHEYLRRIKAAFPALDVELTVNISRGLDQDLAAGRLDLAIQTAPFETPATGVSALGSFPYIWVAAPSIAGQLPAQPQMSDLLAHSILTHAKHTQAFGELSAHLSSRSLPVARVVSSSSLASCVPMAVDGMGVALLPEALVTKEIAQGDLDVISAGWLPSPLHFAARFQKEKSARPVLSAAEIAIDIAREENQKAAPQ